MAESTGFCHLYSVVTTIQSPTSAMESLAKRVRQVGGTTLIIGDKKGPDGYDLDGASFCSLIQQQALGFGLGRVLPTDHYCRKNLGYLLAMKGGAKTDL